MTANVCAVRLNRTKMNDGHVLKGAFQALNLNLINMENFLVRQE